MYIYGGNANGVADVLGFDIRRRSWSVVADEAVTTAKGPGPMFGHVSIPVVTDSFRSNLLQTSGVICM